MTDLESLWILTRQMPEEDRRTIAELINARDERIAELVREVNALNEGDA